MLPAERNALKSRIARWRARDVAGASVNANVIDAAIYLAWASARQSGDLNTARRDGPTARAIAETFANADRRYGSQLFAVAAEHLTPAVCAAIGEVWDSDGADQWLALPVDLFGDFYEQRGSSALRKSSGVYYTPRHVVHELVASTLPALLRDQRIDPAALRILDPACGCGAFLIGAYRHLLEWQASHEGTVASELPTSTRLALAARHLHGIDLDPQAIEVARLSLLFEALYGFDPPRGEARGTDFAPCTAALREHLVCGDALVATPFGADADAADLRPLDVQQAFSQVFAQGGFDLVLGNPPYVSYGGRQAVPLSPGLRAYYAEHYRTAGWLTTHSLFMERAVTHFAKGITAFIVPDQVGHLEGYRSLRRLLLEQAHLVEVRYWGEDVFAGVNTPSLTFVLQKPGGDACPTTVIDADGTKRAHVITGDQRWVAPRASAVPLLEKLRQRAFSLRPYLADCGVRTTDAKAQVVPVSEARDGDLPVLEGKQVARYRCERPRVAVRLQGTKPVHLRKREHYDRAAFLIRQTAAYPIVGPRWHATYFRNSLHALNAPDTPLDVRYLVALLNSKVMRFAYVATVREAEQRVFPQVKLGALGQLPVRAIDFNERDDRAQHDGLVASVHDMLTLQEQQMRNSTPQRTLDIAALDQHIDALVYRLYELDSGEIAAIENVVNALPLAP